MLFWKPDNTDSLRVWSQTDGESYPRAEILAGQPF